MHAGTAEPVRVSPPEAVAYPLELTPALTLPQVRYGLSMLLLEAFLTRLGRLTVLGQVLCWHQAPQNVLTAVALGKQLFDELEQTLQRVPSYRTHLLSDGDGSLCERKPFCFRP